MTTIELNESTVKLMVALGFLVLAEDGIYELTESGGKWLREWCDEERRAPTKKENR